MGQKIQAILEHKMLEAKRELLLFVNQTKETIRYQTDKQAYIKELLAKYSNLSTDKSGCICFFGRWYVNNGFPVLSDEEVLAQMKRFYLCYVEKPMLGESGAIDAAESEGGLFLERWNKYNWLKNLLDMLEQPQQVQVSTPLPVELQTDEAIKRFERAEKAGIIERTQTGYRKKGISKAMLAYFLQKVFLQDSRANDLFPDKELSTIFNESRLGAAVTSLMNNKNGKPKGYKQIDDLFID